MNALKTRGVLGGKVLDKSSLHEICTSFARREPSTTIHHCFLGNLIDARHVVDGHREKTLALLWQIIFHFQVSCGPYDSSLLRYQSFVK